MRILLSILFLTLSLFAQNFGELSLFVLKNGKPLTNHEIELYKLDSNTSTKITNKNFITDEDGYLRADLVRGKYKVQVIVKENSMPLAYAKKNVFIEKGRESQIIISLTSTGGMSFSDVEAPEAKKGVVEKKELKKELGTLALTLISSEDKKGVANARVFVKGTSIDETSDKSGNVNITLFEGEHIISIIHSDFSAQNVKVTVVAKKNSKKSVELTPAAMELEEFVVLAPSVEGSIASLTAEMKKSSAIADILGSEQLSKKGDSNAAAALKRVSGVTIVDGKNIFVRGLGERYANVQLNGLTLPSPNPIKRVVPLDIFPASVIGSLKVQKSFSADIPASFGGGYIDIRTKKEVSSNYIKFSTGISGTSSTGDDALYYQGGGNDWTGYDDGTREIPAEILAESKIKVGEKTPVFNPSFRYIKEDSYFVKDDKGNSVITPAGSLAFTKKMAGSRKLNTHTDKVPYGYNGSFEISRGFNVDDKHSFGVLANYSYGQSNDFDKQFNYGFDLDDEGIQNDIADSQGTWSNTKTNYKHGGIINLNYSYDDKFNIVYTKLYLKNTYEGVRQFEGISGSNNSLIRNTFIEWQERELSIDQITGDYKYFLLVPNTLRFGIEKASAELYQPGDVKSKYIDNNPEDPEIGFEFNMQPVQNLTYQNIESTDDVDHYFLNNRFDITLFDKNDFFEIGIDSIEKTRESRINKYYFDVNRANASGIDGDEEKDVDLILDKYITQNDQFSSRVFELKTLFSPSDYFDAEFEEKSLYAKTLLNITDKIEVSFGVRKVDLKQTIFEFVEDRENSNIIKKEPNSIEVNDFFPNIDLKYKFNDDNQMRFGFSRTFIYPDFREFSNSGFEHPDELATVTGNPDLTHTEIDNYDFRIEHYFSATESVSASLFYKSMKNPIEDTVLLSTSLPRYSFMNSESATIKGLELDGYKFLDFIDDSLEFYYISGNFSFIKSNVEIGADKEDIFSTNNRELQGLSPMIINLSLGYDNKDGRSVNLSYNKMDERIRKIGQKNGIKFYPDSVEIPPHILDLTWKEKFSDMITVSFKARNLLDDEVVWKELEKVTKQYKKGRSFSISLTYKY